jgi:hypothetical protein
MMMSAKKIYLVQGNCGEYSDHREWVVCAYEDEAMAQAHAKKAKEWLQQNVTHDTPFQRVMEMKNPYDDGGYGTDVQTDWTAYGVEIRRALPRVRAALAQTGGHS